MPRLLQRAWPRRLGWLSLALSAACFVDHGEATSEATSDATTSDATTTTTGDETSDATDVATDSDTATTEPACPPGELGCPCEADACAGGLSCSSGVCVEPVCGDGVVDEGEVCDDGNTEEGDGCNTDCVVSGTLRWQRDLGDGGVYQLHDVAVDDAGWIYATGIKPGEQSEFGDIWVVRLDPDGGAIDWEQSFDYAGGGDRGLGIAVEGEVLAVCGVATADDGFSVAWTHKLQTDGAAIWAAPSIYSGIPERHDVANDVVIASGLVGVVGAHGADLDFDMWSAIFDGAGAIAIEHTTPTPGDDVALAQTPIAGGTAICGWIDVDGESRPALRTFDAEQTVHDWISPGETGRILDCRVDSSGEVLAIASTDSEHRLLRFSFNALLAITLQSSSSLVPAHADGIALDAATTHVFTVGFEQPGGQADISVRRAASATYVTAIWSRQQAGAFGGDDRASAVAVLQGGDLAVVGWVETGASDRRGWIGRFAP